VIADLRELERRTGGPAGARRLCWGEEWRAGRELLAELLAEIGLEPERDQAGNLWAYLEGDAEPALALGSHLDSVPGGGWLDGALGVMAALGVLRGWREAGQRPSRTLALVDWADEEGARFGRSLFGSSAVAGTLDPAELERARDADGQLAAELLRQNGVELETAVRASERRGRLNAYLELHIEQGPVLEREGIAVAAVRGCVGIERHRLRFAGQAAHAGTTPMEARRDAGLAAAETALRIERVGIECGGKATSGQLDLRPGIPTVVAGVAELTVDLRHEDPVGLERLLERALVQAGDAASSRGCELATELVWRIAPVRFDPGLVSDAVEASATGTALTSGALHDAAEIARVLPAAMLFCRSIAGISHAPEEDTSEADLASGIEAFGRLAARALRRG
jgi:hydantoinase/carbamoylase family amidase